MNEETYHAKIDKLFLDLEDCLSSAEPELDWDLQEGLFIIVLPQGSQLILSRQPALQELWLASPTGAFHFQMHQQEWITRQGETLMGILKQIFKHFHVQVRL